MQQSCRNVKDHLQKYPLTKIHLQQPTRPYDEKKSKCIHIFGFSAITRERYILLRNVWNKKFFSSNYLQFLFLLFFFICHRNQDRESQR